MLKLNINWDKFWTVFLPVISSLGAIAWISYIFTAGPVEEKKLAPQVHIHRIILSPELQAIEHRKLAILETAQKIKRLELEQSLIIAEIDRIHAESKNWAVMKETLNTLNISQ